VSDTERHGYGGTIWCDPCQQCSDDVDAVRKALALIFEYGQIPGDHHRAWVIDQIGRLLARDDYEKLVMEACQGEDGPETYDWDVGIAP
jgi:hypothetical protein